MFLQCAAFFGCCGGVALAGRLPTYLGGFRSPLAQPADPAFIGSEQLILVSMWSHFTHSKVRTSYPEGPGIMKENIMRFWHPGQRGCSMGMREGSGCT